MHQAHCNRILLWHLTLAWHLLPRSAFALQASFSPSFWNRRELIATVVPTLMMTPTTTSTSARPATSSTESSEPMTETPQESIRWGIVGLGDVCQKKSGPAFWKCGGSQLAAVMRRTPGKAAAFAQQVPTTAQDACVGYEDLDAFLAHPGLDAVYISTRPGTHLELCRKVAEAGKACYVEKPVGRCAEETQLIQETFQRAGLPLYTAYISRAYDRTQATRRLIRDGALGDTIESISYKLVGSGGARDMQGDLPWRLDAPQSGGGLIMDVGCHILDRIDYLCGPLLQVEGHAMKKDTSSKQDVEDYVAIKAITGSSSWASMPGCAGAQVECSWDFASKEESPCDELTIAGNKATLQMVGMSPNGAMQLVDNKSGNIIKELSFDMPEHTAQQLIQAVTNELRGMKQEPPKDYLSFGDNALRTQKVIDAALTPYYGDRDIGFWERTESWVGRPKLT